MAARRRRRKQPPQTLLAYRTRKGLTQREAASLFEISQPTYCNIENAKARPRPELAKKMAKLTSIPIVRILRLDDERAS